ncbi:MAG: DUF6268 family outer membrane beta-barrel protein [Planctomycetota bacterium]|nr:DUF6268 family outer membrane beta-barrel protein [Planctomycetota bacterium]
MNLIFRWQFPSLLILLIFFLGLDPACAQSSFLDEFRLQSDLQDSDDQEHSAAHTMRDESVSGRALLDDATQFAGFESDYAPELNNIDVPLVRHRTTSFQGAQSAYGFIPSGGSDGLGIQTFDLLGTFAVPIDGMDHVITFTPFFRMDQLNPNATLDVPDAIFETGVKSFWKKVINERLTTMVLFTPSVRSDLQSSNDAFKLFGMALLQWRFTPDKLSMTGGAIYTGRQDFPVLPTMGLLWTPSPVWRFDIQFPSPRFSRHILKDNNNSETWAYLSGVFGGNTWAIKRASGQDDQLTLRDLRLVLGVEHLLRENQGVFVETGWVFSRSVEYGSTPGQIDLGDAIMMRAGIQF